MKIGVFDSGIGGEKIAQLIQEVYPETLVVSVSDKDNLPYGTKTKEQLALFVLPKLLRMQQDGCDIIVVACNTVTTVLISDIRKALYVPVIGFEPMVKPAATLTKSGTIAVCATPATLGSDRYAQLKRQFASNISIIEPDCSDWASLIEKNEITTNQVRRVTDEIVQQKADVVVLGCTHYHWIETMIIDLVGDDVIVLQPEEAVMHRLASIVEKTAKA